MSLISGLWSRVLAVLDFQRIFCNARVSKVETREDAELHATKAGHK